MVNKYLSSYEQLRSKCPAKIYCDVFKMMQGETTIEDSGGKPLYYSVNATTGNLSLNREGHAPIEDITPCEALKIAEFILKVYGEQKNEN